MAILFEAINKQLVKDRKIGLAKILCCDTVIYAVLKNVKIWKFVRRDNRL